MTPQQLGDQPAFPCPRPEVVARNADGSPRITKAVAHDSGLTKRELFAALAMSGLLANSERDCDIDTDAHTATIAADALLARLVAKGVTTQPQIACPRCMPPGDPCCPYCGGTYGVNASRATISPPASPLPWREEVAGLVEWADAHLDCDVSDMYKAQPLAQDWARVSKVCEEAGEAIDALIGMTGQNPRKGVYGGRDQLLDELADVVMTGLYAIQHFTKDSDTTMAVVIRRARRHKERIVALANAAARPDAGEVGR